MECACLEGCCWQRSAAQNVQAQIAGPCLMTIRIATVALILLRSRKPRTAQTFLPGWSEKFATSCGLAQGSHREILVREIPASASRLGSRLAAACSLRCWQRPYLCGTASAARSRRHRAHPPRRRSRLGWSCRILDRTRPQRRKVYPRSLRLAASSITRRPSKLKGTPSTPCSAPWSGAKKLSRATCASSS